MAVSTEGILKESGRLGFIATLGSSRENSDHCSRFKECVPILINHVDSRPEDDEMFGALRLFNSVHVRARVFLEATHLLDASSFVGSLMMRSIS